MSIYHQEREKYDSAWMIPAYAERSPAENYLPVFLERAKAPATVLDAGTGSGKGAVVLRDAGFTVTLCDCTSEGLVDAAKDLPFREAWLWNDLRDLAPRNSGRTTFDYVFCCDVLEHVPTPLTMLAVARMLEVAKHGLFLTVRTVSDDFGHLVGHPLHLTVQPFVWWRDHLATVGRVLEARDLLIDATFWVTR